MQANYPLNPQTFENFVLQKGHNVYPAKTMDCSSVGEKRKSCCDAMWQRVKWTDEMARLLITAISYIGDDTQYSLKKGKWKVISNVMSEQCYSVSPQQCEDKFNDLNKRYKRLNDIIGRGTCCKVVENPELLNLMDISEKGKRDVRKILSSKQLFYREMCSYHNGNRLYLPHDLVLHQSLQSILKSGSCKFDEENDSDGRNGDYTTECLGDASRVFTEVEEREFFLRKWIIDRSGQLKEQMLMIEAQMLQLKEDHSKWMRFGEIETRELDEMRLANEYLRTENKCLALEFKRRLKGADYT